MIALFSLLILFASACDDHSAVIDSNPEKAIQFLNDRCFNKVLISPALLPWRDSMSTYPEKFIAEVHFNRRGNYAPDILTVFTDKITTLNPRRIFFETYGVALPILTNTIKVLNSKDILQPGDLISKNGENFEVLHLYVNYQKVIIALLYSPAHHTAKFESISHWTLHRLLGERPN